MIVSNIQENYTTISILNYEYFEQNYNNDLLENTLYIKTEHMIDMTEVILFLNRSKIKNTCYLVSNIKNPYYIESSNPIYSEKYTGPCINYVFFNIMYIKCETEEDLQEMKKYIIKEKLKNGDNDNAKDI